MTPAPAAASNPADQLPFNGVLAFAESDYRRLLVLSFDLHRIALALFDSTPDAARALLEASAVVASGAQDFGDLHDSIGWKVLVDRLHQVAGLVPEPLSARVRALTSAIAGLVSSAHAFSFASPDPEAVEVAERLMWFVRIQLEAALAHPGLLSAHRDAADAALRALRWASAPAARRLSRSELRTLAEEACANCLLHLNIGLRSASEPMEPYARARGALRDAFRGPVSRSHAPPAIAATGLHLVASRALAAGLDVDAHDDQSLEVHPWTPPDLTSSIRVFAGDPDRQDVALTVVNATPGRVVRQAIALERIRALVLAESQGPGLRPAALRLLGTVLRLAGIAPWRVECTRALLGLEYAAPTAVAPSGARA